MDRLDYAKQLKKNEKNLNYDSDSAEQGWIQAGGTGGRPPDVKILGGHRGGRSCYIDYETLQYIKPEAYLYYLYTNFNKTTKKLL